MSEGKAAGVKSYTSKCDAESDNDDQWLFESVKTYGELLIYELLYPTRVIEWTTNNSVCVVSLLPNGRSELLQLELPSSLLPEYDDVCKEYDFSMINGGFYDHHIIGLKHLSNTTLLAAAQINNNCAVLWNMPNGASESGIITQTEALVNCHPSSCRAVLDVHDNKVVFGDSSHSLCIADISANVTSAVAHDNERFGSEVLSRVWFADENCILGCSQQSGCITLWDLRVAESSSVKQFAVPVPPQQQQQDCSLKDSSVAWTCRQFSAAPFSVLRLAADGFIDVTDLRKENASVTQSRISHSFTAKDPDLMTISISSSDESFSISGCDSNVYLYKMPDASTSTEPLKPYFIHKGHERESCTLDSVTVWTCCWHPGPVLNTLLSAASDGSIHAWQYTSPDDSRPVTA